MRRSRSRCVASCVVPLALGVCLLAARSAAAEQVWPIQTLARSADVIVAGQVVGLDVRRDGTGGIYTYVTVTVGEWLKGPVPTSTLVVKQLGGRIGADSAMVPGQARFTLGEHVLLFLDARPRDGSLYTSALWQGKWTIERPSANYDVLVRQRPLRSRIVDAFQMDVVRDEVRVEARFATRTTRPSIAADVRTGVAMGDVADPPVRWNEPVVLVHLVEDTEAPVEGGGAGEISAAVRAWSSAASGLVLAEGGRLPSRCVQDIDPSTGIRVIFSDPCGEISDNGNLLALTVVRSTDEGGQTINHQSYHRITDAFITTSQHPSALALLSDPMCLRSRLTHELGHALGLDDSDDPSAAMFGDDTNGCLGGGPIETAPADLAALVQIYPAGASNASIAVTSVSATNGLLTVAWTPVPGAPATAHRLDFFAGTTPVVSVPVGGDDSAVLPVPPGATGIYTVRVTPIVGGAPGASSAAFPFTLGTTPGCATLAAPAMTGTVVNGVGTVSWQAVPGAAAYLVQAGTAQGGSNLFPASNVGTATAVSASGLPAGFSAWVRVAAVNACGHPGTPRDVLIQ